MVESTVRTLSDLRLKEAYGLALGRNGKPVTKEEDVAGYVHVTPRRTRDGEMVLYSRNATYEAIGQARVIVPEVMVANARTIHRDVQGIVKCAHEHDTGVSGYPEGVSWVFGWIKRPGTGRECPVCTPEETRHGCLNAHPGKTSGYGRAGPANRARTCSERHAAWKAAGRAKA